MDVGPKDPTKLEARSPQPGRSGFLNSAARPAPVSGGAGQASDGRQALTAGLPPAVDRESLGRLLSGVGLKLGAEGLSRVGDRVASALALLAARSPSYPAQASGRPAAPGQSAISAYERLSARRQKAGATEGRSRFLAVLAGLFEEAGFDLDPGSLISLDTSLEDGGGEGNAGGDLPGQEDGRSPSGGGSSGESPSRRRSPDGRDASPSAPVGAKEPLAAADIDSLVAMLKDFLSAAGEGPNHWQAFNEAEGRRDPSWRLVPFAFSANGIDFEGFFRILCRREPKAVLSLGADFRSNGHDYSFSLRGSSLSLEGPGEGLPGRDAALRALGRSLDELGIGFSFSALRGIELPRLRGETWA